MVELAAGVAVDSSGIARDKRDKRKKEKDIKHKEKTAHKRQTDKRENEGNGRWRMENGEHMQKRHRRPQGQKPAQPNPIHSEEEKKEREIKEPRASDKAKRREKENDIQENQRDTEVGR